MTRLEGEVTRLLKTALEGKEAKVRFEGIEPANPLGVRANVVVTLPSSRFGNADTVKKLFLDMLDKYVNSTERGVFGSTFNGYLRTR